MAENKKAEEKEPCVAVALADLRKEFGPKAGEEKYRAVRNLVFGTQPLIEPNLDEQADASIGISGLKPETRAAVDAILNAKE